jgi:hypothetical protein
MIRTFLDSGVIIAAACGTTNEKEAALAILEDADRILITSPFVELEVLPHAEREGTPESVTLYRRYFEAAESYSGLEQMVSVAAEEMRRTRIHMADALHLAGAHLAGADEFITTEKLSKPMHQNTLVDVKRLK